MRSPAPTILGTLHELAERRALARRAPVLVSCSEPSEPLDPFALFAAETSGAPRVLWIAPQASEVLVALHCHRVPVTASAPSSTTTLAGDLASAAPHELPRRWRTLATEALAEGPLPPLAIAGWAFDPADRREDEAWQPFGSLRLFLPRLLYRQRGELAFRSWQILARPGEAAPTLPPWPHASPSAARGESLGPWQRREQVTRDQWETMVRSALAAIESGELHKVVLARSVELTGLTSIDLEWLLHSLVERYPTCAVFAVGFGEKVFLGATPERLARVEGGTVTTVALAGSLPRQPGAASERTAGTRLLTSGKDRHEHALVVAAIRESLTPLCRTLDIPDHPEIVAMPNVYHLATPITGVLHDGLGALDVALRLHPTPAVGGTPREAALAFIRRHEPVSRGWYAGALGWIEASGDGEFVVTLRSALVQGTRARLYAGCGIVAGSDPTAEWDEAEAKLQPMLQALTGA